MSQQDSQPETTRACVVDLGTNSFHAVVVDLTRDMPPKVIDKLKVTVALGEGLVAGVLTASAVDRARRALEDIHTLCERRGVEHTRAYATSAIREARNGDDFANHIADTLGIQIEPIPGEREAELVWMGVRDHLDLDPLSLVMDIGGGSTEFALGSRTQLLHATSLRLGAGRLTQQFIRSDPPTKAEIERLEDHLDERLGALLDQAKDAGARRLIGSSGTMENLCELAHAHAGREGTAYQQPLDPPTLIAFIDELVQMTAEERARLGALDAHRVDQIAAGGVLLRKVLRRLEPTSVLPSRAAMREGMIRELVDELKLREQPGDSFDVERRHFLAMARRHRRDLHHAQHVATLCDTLFQALQPLHELGERDRELLDRAALVHDVGKAIAGRRHHKHSRYIVEQARWPGVPSSEVDLIAMLVRYHRRARPKKKHDRYGSLGKADRRRVRRLAAILRLAESLDRSHTGNVHRVDVEIRRDGVQLVLHAHGSPELELRAAERATRAFYKAYGRDLHVDAAWTTS